MTQVLEAGYIFSAMPCCLEGSEFNVASIYPLLSEDPLFTPLGSLPLGRLQCFYICRPSGSDIKVGKRVRIGKEDYYNLAIRGKLDSALKALFIKLVSKYID